MGCEHSSRICWDCYFLELARTVSLRADCSRRKVGAIIVKDNRMVSSGYNGAPAGEPGCLAGNCPRALNSNVVPLKGYDEIPCHALHAENNAIAYASYDQTKGATIYITCPPCYMCEKVIKAAGIVRIVHDPEPLTTQAI